MAALGLPFRVVVSRYEEAGGAHLEPAALALEHARGKAAEVAARVGVPAGGCVIGVDTAVAVDGRALGKPETAREAATMLERLAGREHEVVSGLVLIDVAGERSLADVARVRFRPLDAAALRWYVATGEWRGRAGGYAIQGAGAALVERVEGDYTTVVGLPLGALVTLLEERGLAPWQAA